MKTAMTLFIFSPLFVFAQGEETTIEPISQKKNEIGISITAPLTSFLGGQGENVTQGLIYKRRLKNPKYLFRFHPEVLITNNWENNYFPIEDRIEVYHKGRRNLTNEENNYFLNTQGVNFQIRRYYVMDDQPEIRLGLGLEREFGSKKIKGYYGLEIFGSYQSKRYEERDYFYNLTYDSENLPVYIPDFDNALNIRLFACRRGGETPPQFDHPSRYARSTPERAQTFS